MAKKVSREKAVEEQQVKHLGFVSQTLEALDRLLNHYLAGDKAFKTEAGEVHRLEHEADIVRRELKLQLYAGAFLPIYREDYSVLAEEADKIANRCEDVSDFVVLTRPKIPPFMQSHLRAIMVETRKSFDFLSQTLDAFLQALDTVNDAARKVQEEEQKIDELVWEAEKALFKSELSLAEKLHLKQLVDRLGEISNRVEDVAMHFELMVVKRKM